MKTKKNKRDINEYSGEFKKIIIFILMFVLLAGLTYLVDKQTASDSQAKTNLDLYVMSQCPYGTQAEDLVKQSMEGFEDYINFNVEYIATQNQNGELSSLHGPSEVQGNKYQLCVKKYYPQKFWDYLTCQNKDYQNLTATFQSCAEENELNFDKIEKCATSKEANELLSQSIHKANSLGVTASPTFYLNHEKYEGPRTKLALQRKYCSVLDNQPEKCDQLPQQSKFTAYLIYDSRCQKEECQTENLTAQLKNNFATIEFEKIDYANPQGKEFYQKYELDKLPAVLFEQAIKQTDNFNQISNYLTPEQELYKLAIGASHDPTQEICENGIDDTGNGLVDCQDDECSSNLVCRVEKKNKLDLFVMSMCPYGTRAMEAMVEVLDNFKDINFEIHYIADETQDGSFQSLHGQKEVDENIRELCAMKYYPQSYLEYIGCRNNDLNQDWQKCATGFPKIKNCFDGQEGKNLLSQDIQLAEELNISASPTWLVNNKYIFNGIDAETVRKNYCQYNDVKGCDNNTLSQNKATQTGACN